MNSTYDKPMFNLIADANCVWSARLEQPCTAGIASIFTVDQTVRAGP